MCAPALLAVQLRIAYREPGVRTDELESREFAWSADASALVVDGEHATQLARGEQRNDDDRLQVEGRGELLWDDAARRRILDRDCSTVEKVTAYRDVGGDLYRR